MGLLSRWFGNRPAAAALAPLIDPTLGRLRWDEDSEGWVGDIELPDSDRTARLYIGSGSEREYPSQPMLRLLSEPYRDFRQLAAAALDYLYRNMDIDAWLAAPEAFRVEGLESYGHHLDEGLYSITFTNGDAEAIWKVHFRQREPVACGVDD